MSDIRNSDAAKAESLLPTRGTLGIFTRKTDCPGPGQPTTSTAVIAIIEPGAGAGVWTR